MKLWSEMSLSEKLRHTHLPEKYDYVMICRECGKKYQKSSPWSEWGFLFGFFFIGISAGLLYSSNENVEEVLLGAYFGFFSFLILAVSYIPSFFYYKIVRAIDKKLARQYYFDIFFSAMMFINAFLLLLMILIINSVVLGVFENLSHV